MVPTPEALCASGRYGDALLSIRSIESQRQLTTPECVLLAELLSLTGDVDAAFSAAGTLLRRRDLSAAERSRMNAVLGRSEFRRGRSAQGAEHYRVGIDVAERSHNTLEEVRLRVDLFLNEIHWLGPQQPASRLALLRRQIHHVAEPTVTITFHLALAELAAKLGLVPRANRHLETARALLPVVRNLAVEANVKVTEVALSLLEANFGDAYKRALELVTLIEHTQSGSAKFSLATNLGHLQFVQGRFGEAKTSLTSALAEREFVGPLQVPIRDTLMMLHVDQGEFADADELAGSIEELLSRGSSRDSYFGLWHLVTRVKWLYRLGRPEDGLALALDAIPRIERMADRNLLHRMRLLAAEGLGRTGLSATGTEAIAGLINNESHLSLDIFAESLRVAGRLAAKEDVGAAHTQFSTAARILNAIGNLAAEAEVRRDADETSVGQLDAIERRRSTEGPGTPKAFDVRPAAAQLSERIAALIEVGSHPPLLASEAFSLIVDTQSVSRAVLIEELDGRLTTLATFPESKLPSGLGDLTGAVRIKLGTHRSRRYEIAAWPRTGSAARGSLIAVEQLTSTALAVARSRQLDREQAALWPEQTPEAQLGLICSSDRMVDLVKTIRRVAATNLTALLTGETGVGKELFARALHRASARSARDFLPFNCSTVARDMFDSQLFGHRRGSFTGAHADAPGVIRAAAGGTLFLDEIGEMTLESQPKLLRFLESGEILPLGESKPHTVDVRIVAATNANLDQLVADGRFREDLYYRLNVIRIDIPPLRERREEIPALVDHFLERFGHEQQKPIPRVSDETLEYLVLYRWPGNIRQLANEIRRMVALAEPGAVLMPAHLSNDIAASRRTVPVSVVPRQATEVVTRIDQPLAAAVEHIERAAIQRAMAACEGRLDEAAKMLGLSRKGLYLKRQRLRLE